MKKLLALVLCIGILLCGCADLLPRKSTLPTAEPVPETVPENPPLFTPEPTGDALHDAYRAALETIHNELYMPVLTAQITPYDSIEDESFAIFDIDGDGKEELIVRIMNTYMADMTEVIYGFREETGSLYVELAAFPALTIYPGVIRADWSHDHGLGGGVLWPYDVYTYDAQRDIYVQGASVDAWTRSVASTRQGEPYPASVDTDNHGTVYLITQEHETRIVSYSDYLGWEAPIFAGLEEIRIPWQELTAQNVSLVAPQTGLSAGTGFSGYLWNGEKSEVTVFAAPGRIEFAIRDFRAMVTGELPAGLPPVEGISCTFDDFNGDGFSDPYAQLRFTNGEEACIQWMSEGESLYYNEEFSRLPGQPSARGD